MKNFLAAVAFTLTLLSPLALSASEVRGDVTTQRGAGQQTICRTTSTDLDFVASDSNFAAARESFNQHLAGLGISDPTARMNRAQDFRVAESAQYFSVSVDTFICDQPARKTRAGKAESSLDSIQARTLIGGVTAQSCDFVGCVEGWPGSNAPEGSTMTVTTCETNVKTTVTYKKINGQWTVTEYRQELVVECGPAT